MYIRSFDLGGSGLKTAVYLYDTSTKWVEELTPKEQLGRCPERQTPSIWIREKITTLYKEIESNYFFGFSLAGFDKLTTTPFNDSDMSKVFDLPSDKVAAIDDGAAHLLSSLRHFGFKGKNVWNFALGTGVGLGIKDSEGNVLCLYGINSFLKKYHHDFRIPSYIHSCASQIGFEQLVKENNGIVDESVFDTFAATWKTILEKHFLKCNPFEIIFTGGHTEIYGNKLEKKLYDLGLKVAIYTGPKFAGLKGAAWNVIHHYFLSDEKESNFIQKDKDALGFHPFFRAIISKDNTLIDKFLEEGAPINARDFAGQTALFYAVKQNNVTLMKKLISLGADRTMRDYWKQNALDLAKQGNNLEMIDLLTQ